ncbi:30S ribosomal protein S16 [Halodesulfovibrio aestuarii]|uniref:Small ribosomal subunit protein bS16 n=1 Tax=Halodesulfovibrio aestuarii TaxID=126333 RepID=A0A8G2FB56_9BACT|nr:30S ribosomal protein S16 [Halodesulfovibrio aestuarii]SHJ11655.1 SSU ribosomal protein S16P [Halodesulfovibrio aestuarii]
MAVKLRLTRMGNKKRAFYRVVAANNQSRRDGRPLEYLGYYNPMVEPAEIKLDMEKIEKWIAEGAEPTATVRGLIKKAK